jgi:GNAT superfamily N-acetyltransferase
MGEAAIHVRPATAQDLDFVLGAVERLAAFGPPPWRPAREIVEGEVRTLRAFFASPPPGSALFLAEGEGDGARLGFVYLERLEDYFTRQAHGHVGMLVVERQAEGQGVGSRLMQWAEAWAREQGYGRLTLTVFEGNQRARAAYHRLGYQPETLRYVKIL